MGTGFSVDVGLGVHVVGPSGFFGGWWSLYKHNRVNLGIKAVREHYKKSPIYATKDLFVHKLLYQPRHQELCSLDISSSRFVIL